nr:reverse transcriptase domain-containing protein [Tanacetum cinerariifolium]
MKMEMKVVMGMVMEVEIVMDMEMVMGMEMKDEMETGMGLKEELVWQGGLRRWNLCFTSVTDHQDGLPDIIQGNVTSFKPIRLQDAIRMANILIDQKVRVNTARQADNKRKWKNHLRDNHVHQQTFKRPNVARVYTAGRNEKKAYS